MTLSIDGGALHKICPYLTSLAADDHIGDDGPMVRAASEGDTPVRKTVLHYLMFTVLYLQYIKQEPQHRYRDVFFSC